MNDSAEETNSEPEREAYIIVAQNNQKNTVKIKEVSLGAAELLGRLPEEIEGLPIQEILGRKIAETMDEYLEYDDEADDFDQILGRIYEFRLKHYNGEELLLAHKIIREPARDQNQWFRIMLKDERRQITEKSLLNILQDNLAGVQSIDEESGLPDHYSCEQYLEMVHHYVESHDFNACFAILRLDRHEKSKARYGKAQCIELLKHVANCCKSKFREDDLVCRLSDNTIGLLLMDISLESARIVLNRLRWFIRSHRIVFGGKSDFSITVSIIYSQIRADQDDVLKNFETSARKIDRDARNEMIELKG